MMLPQPKGSVPSIPLQAGWVRLAARIVFGMWAGVGLAKMCLAAPSSHSLNAHTGTMDVDYAEYLSKHDVVFNHPIANPVHGSTVGNGRVGVMVWNQDGLRLQISGVDASEQTAFSAGLIHLQTNPAMDASYSAFQQRLSLYDGVLTTKYDADRTVTILGSPDSEVIGIHVSDARPGVSRVSLDLSIWDVSKLAGGDVPNIDTWRSVTNFANATGIGLSRGQEDPNNFGYTLAARVQGASFITQSIDTNTVRLVITPSPSYTIWVACASRLNAPNHDSVLRAKSLLSEVESRGYAATMADYEHWWHAFWQKSFVQYSNSVRDGDYLENLYYLYTYIIAAGSYANYPFHFINGPFTAVEDANSTKWSVAYWYWNQRDVYNSFLTSNHPAVLHVLNHLYSRNIALLEAHTREKFGIDGIWVPETMRWDGNARNAENSDWTRDILSTGTEAAENMYAEYEYTNDTVYLRTIVYPFMKAVAQFYSGLLARDPETGKFYLAKSNAHETYWDVRNAITDLGAIRSLFPATIRASEQLGVDAEIRDRWRMALDNLTDYPLAEDQSRYAPHDPPTAKSHNGENITSELIWPYGVTGIGAPDYQLALNGWLRRPYAYGNIWSSDAVQAARLGLGDEVLMGMNHMIRTYQSYPNGLTNDTNGRFEYLGSHLSAINESLLQSYNGKIRVFPAVPNDPDFVGRFTLLAKGGFLVTSEFQDRDIKYVAIKSLYGNPFTIVNPWRGEAVQARRAMDHRTMLTTSEPDFTIHTRANTVYIIERSTKPLRGYAHQRLSGKANNDVKRLTDSPAVLGGESTGHTSGVPTPPQSEE